MVVAHQPTTILLADQSDVSRFGLRGLLQRDRRFAIVGDAPADAIGAAQRLQPDLILIDPFHAAELDLRIIDELHRVDPNARLVILTAAFEPQTFMAAMLKRVHGYFLKDSGGQGALLVDALTLVARFGVVIVDAPIADHFWSASGTRISAYVPRATILTTREAEILMLAVQEHSDKQIADRLGLSVRTVEHHVQQASQKLGASNRIQLGWLLHERGVLQATL